jgi:general secretion pathway protein B
MSYILDALKKAESERKLGSVPDMHAQSYAGASDGEAPLRGRVLAWGTLAALLIAAMVLAWWMPWRTNQQLELVASLPRTEAGSQQSRSGSIDQPQPSGTSDAAPAADASAPASADASDAPPPGAEPARPKAVSRPKPAPKAPPKSSVSENATPAKVKGNESPRVAAAPRSAETRNKAVPRAVTPAAESRLPALRELPEHIQREIPAMAVGGYIYSNVPSERSVLINNRLLHEGSEITPGLVLEKMLPREAVLNYKGYRYRISY